MSHPHAQSAHIPLVSGLSDIADHYDAFILDLFGVIHNGLKLYDGTLGCLSDLKHKGKKTCLLSNTPKRSEDSRKDLRAMGLDDDMYTGIITAGDSAREELIKRQGQKCWFAARMEFFGTLIEDLDLDLLDGPEGADFILNAIGGIKSIDDTEIFKQLDKAIEMDLPMICANPDLVVHVGDQLNKCAGTYAKYYEDRGGSVHYCGKPHAPVYDMAMDVLGQPDKDKTLAIGDSLHTDIQGANKYGINSCFNLVGIHWEEVQLDHSPGRTDIDKVQKMIDKQDHRPTYTMAGFNW